MTESVFAVLAGLFCLAVFIAPFLLSSRISRDEEDWSARDMAEHVIDATKRTGR